MRPDEHIHHEDIDEAVAAMEELRGRYEKTQRLAFKEGDDGLYNYARNRKNAVQECINIMVEHGLY